MSLDTENKRTLYERLQDNYRLVIVDEEDLKEVNNYKFNLMTLYILLSTMVVVFGGIMFSLIIFTPVKKLIPGYGDINDNSKFIELSQKVEELENLVASQEVYNQGLRNMLLGTDESSPVSGEPQKNSPETVLDQDLKEQSKTRELNQLIFANPVSGTVSATYDPGINHFGVDVIAPKNTAIKSILEGIVVDADWTVNGGNTITIQHPRNLISVYKHNSALLVKTGEAVETGQAISIIGNTGKLTNGPHLHLELWYNGSPVNPSNYISFN